MIRVTVGIFALITCTQAVAAEFNPAPIYSQFASLTKNRDADGLEELWNKQTTTNFFAISGKDKYTRQEMIDAMRENMGRVKTVVESTSKVLSQKRSGKKFIVTVMTSVKLQMNETAGKKPDLFEISTRTEDTWTETKVGYRLEQMKTVRQSVKVNGKPL